MLYAVSFFCLYCSFLSFYWVCNCVRIFPRCKWENYHSVPSAYAYVVNWSVLFNYDREAFVSSKKYSKVFLLRSGRKLPAEINCQLLGPACDLVDFCSCIYIVPLLFSGYRVILLLYNIFQFCLRILFVLRFVLLTLGNWQLSIVLVMKP